MTWNIARFLCSSWASCHYHIINLGSTSTKHVVGMNIQAKQNVNGWNGISFGCALEGDRRAMDRRWNKNDVGPIPSVFCNKCDAPASVLCQLYGHLMSCASCLNGKRIEDVCLPSCRTCLFCFVPLCGLLHLAWLRRCVVYVTSLRVFDTVTSHAMGLPLVHGRTVVPSGRLLSSRIRLTQYNTIQYNTIQYNTIQYFKKLIKRHM